jgi:bifunctional DNase/RNase
MTVDKKFKRLVRDRARRTGQSYASARRELLRKQSEEPMDNIHTSAEDLPVEVTVAGVRADPPGWTSKLILQDTVGGRQLPIGIGPAEATAIAFALQQVAHSRPMTHDALKDTLAALGQLTRIVVGFEAETNTFTADVVLALADGTERHLDWRVSDAVAVAVRCQPPPSIVVPESILAAPPPPIMFQGIEVRCQCGQALHIDEDAIKANIHATGLFEADVECPACGLRQLMRFGPPREFLGQEGR